MSFQINQGATIWDEGGGGGNTIGAGSGPFIVVITPINDSIINSHCDKNIFLSCITFCFSDERKPTRRYRKLL